MATTTSKKEISKNLGRYSGKWVAFVDEKVVAFGDTLEEVANKIEKMKPKKRAVYFLVPRKDEGPYVLKFQISSIKFQTSTKF